MTAVSMRGPDDGELFVNRASVDAGIRGRDVDEIRH